MSQRDDMVMRPQMRDQSAAVGTDARERAREDRRLAGLVRRRNMLRRAMLAKSLRRRVRARRLAAAARKGNLLQGGGTAVRAVRATGRGGLIGIVIAAVVVATAVATRLLSGRSFEGIGQEINNIVLGDLDDEARAQRSAREQVLGDPDLARIIGREGQVNSQIAAIYNDIKAMRLREERGATLFKSDAAFDVNNNWDILILRAKNLIVEHLRANGGFNKLNQIGSALKGIFGLMGAR